MVLVPKLFQPIKVGNVTLQHCIALAPMTRMRCTGDNIPLPIIKDHYDQRAHTPGTLLISEAVQIHTAAVTFPNVPGIHNDVQIAAWKEIIDAVHAKDCPFFMQLWATGHYVSASPIKLRDASETPRALNKEEIKEYIQWYSQAAINAIKAGADGVEIHGANGHLIDQFLQDVSNIREDEYGGSIENRARFGLEIVDAVVKVVGPERTAIRLSPWGVYHDTGMKEPEPQFGYFIEQLKARHPGLTYLHLVEAREHSVMLEEANQSNDYLRKIWAPRPLVSCGAYSRKLALEVAETKGDIIAVGRPFVSNPDLVERWRHDWQLSPYKREFFYISGGGPKGYSDYPLATEAQKSNLVV
ncbi:FMN-linked oxidoreductase [Schizophyllum commune H4-8]|uniref:NADH:flavin oxidoreductase/NADH oxidase N-terminal domain-containing protein n=1 Tax=Schizophyllum commune (strain H4-8 / FGSC 9210) TaxID=578458 RepID=D8QCC1_SCHCM|nr:FMN-linked oxidoreductase [Schizophyllum commune H4-8]KAI5889522.1 FMN-linked oxidoreductase [Schizophyllum commune H4-8]